MRNPRLNPARLALSPRISPWAAGAAPGGAPGTAPPLVAVAHGSKDPRAAATVSELLAVVRERLGPGGPEVRAAFLDHCAPSLAQALASLMPDGPATDPCVPVPCVPVPCITVPLLLTSAYHRKADIPAQLAAATGALPRLDVRCAAPLGPHPLLLTALERRLREAGVAVDDAQARAATSVVLAAAGSSDPAANRAIAAFAARWAALRGWKTVVPAYASAAGPRPADAVTALRDTAGARVVVASYLLAPGHFADKIRSTALAAGASTVSGVLGAAPEVAAVILDRYHAALSPKTARREPALATRFSLLAAKPPRQPRPTPNPRCRFLLLSDPPPRRPVQDFNPPAFCCCYHTSPRQRPALDPNPRAASCCYLTRRPDLPARRQAHRGFV